MVDNPYIHSGLFDWSIYILKVYNIASWKDCQVLGVGFVGLGGCFGTSEDSRDYRGEFLSYFHTSADPPGHKDC